MFMMNLRVPTRVNLGVSITWELFVGIVITVSNSHIFILKSPGFPDNILFLWRGNISFSTDSVPSFLRGCTGMKLNHRAVKPATRLICIFLAIAVMCIAKVLGKGKLFVNLVCSGLESPRQTL